MIHIFDANAALRQDLNRTDALSAMSPRLIYEAANAASIPQIWVWDGPRHNDRRRAIFAGYKIRDYTGQENIFAGLDIYKQLLGFANAIQIEVPDYEADDVCATLARRYANAGQMVTVHTNDFDFFQLTTHPLIKLKGVRPEEGIPPQFVSLYKALCGDKSDKIPGIPGFGKKTFMKYRELWPVLDQALRDRDAVIIRQQVFTPKTTLWLSSDENLELLFDYHLITQVLDVPIELIEQHTHLGTRNPVAAQQLFSRFML